MMTYSVRLPDHGYTAFAGPGLTREQANRAVATAERLGHVAGIYADETSEERTRRMKRIVSRTQKEETPCPTPLMS